MWGEREARRGRPDIDFTEPLRATLLRHGFEHAARYIGWVPDRQATLRAWEGYPACLDHYPTRLRPRTFMAQWKQQHDHHH